MNQNGNEIQSLRRMLREIADLAENASLTGGLSGGAPRAAQRYNAVLNQLVQSGSVPKGIFEEINVETAEFGQLGVDARLLGSYLKGQEGDNGSSRGEASVLVRLAPFIRGEDLGALVRQQLANGVNINSHVITALAPFLGSDQLGQLVREHMIADHAEHTAQSPTAPVSTRLEGETLEELAEKIRRPEISREERDRIAARLAELAQSQQRS